MKGKTREDKVMTVKLDKATTKLFFTEYHLAKFQEAWTNSYLHNGENWVNWLYKISSNGCSLGKVTAKQEMAIETDIQILLDVAKHGCQVLLRDAYHQVLAKKMYEKNSNFHNYLANAYDCISTAQWLLARQFNVHIDWFFPEDEDFKEDYEPARKPGELWEASPGSWYIAA